MLSNSDREKAEIVKRAESLDDERLARVEDLKDLWVEVKNQKGWSDTDVDGLKLHLRRRKEDAKKRAKRLAKEESCQQMELFGAAA